MRPTASRSPATTSTAALRRRFAENVEFFRLDYLDRDEVEFGPLLRRRCTRCCWLAPAGTARRPRSKRPFLDRHRLAYAVLFDQTAFRDLRGRARHGRTSPTSSSWPTPTRRSPRCAARSVSRARDAAALPRLPAPLRRRVRAREADPQGLPGRTRSRRSASMRELRDARSMDGDRAGAGAGLAHRRRQDGHRDRLIERIVERRRRPAPATTRRRSSG